MKWNHCSSVPALPRSHGQGLPIHAPLSLGLLWPPDSLIAPPNAARVALTRTRVPPPLLPQVALTWIWMFLPGLLALCSWKWRLLRIFNMIFDIVLSFYLHCIWPIFVYRPCFFLYQSSHYPSLDIVQSHCYDFHYCTRSDNAARRQGCNGSAVTEEVQHYYSAGI